MILLYALAGVVFVNCLYYLLFSKFVFSSGSVPRSKDQFPVSLMVCAKNEAENLKKNIPFWQAQTYSNFEIVLINDASTDDTLEAMETFASQDPRITVVDVVNNEAFWGNKKYALTLGIKKAKNLRMIFTDADCAPASQEWLSEMASCFSEEKQLILGYGAYEKRRGLLNALIRFETLMTALQYFSYAKAGIPYMGVGRNMGYTSRLYYENNGFMSHIQVRSGDDDLFVNQVATGRNTAVCTSKNSFTYSVPKPDLKSWIQQKRRHITTSKLYRPIHKFLLGAYYLFNLLFWILAPLSLMLQDWNIALVLIGFRFLIQYLIIGKAAVRLKEGNVILLIPILELFLVFVQMTIFISNTVSKPPHWK